ncbi:MAG: hypothetical protein ABI594_08465 [Ginsengibacter sp.]
MGQDEEKKAVSPTNDEPVVIPDECGDSMWDTVLEQSPFIQALKQAAKEESKEKKS